MTNHPFRCRSWIAVLTASLCAAATTAEAAIQIDLTQINRTSPAYQRFKQFVDRAVDGRPGYAFSATDAALLYRLEGADGGDLAYARLAIDLVDREVAAAEAEISAGRRPSISGDSYLEVGPYLRDLSFVYDWCGPLLSASQRSRWSAYAEQAVWNVWNPDQASWGGRPFPWSGWSINDPGNNYHYSFLEATMYWALASNSSIWRSFVQTQKLPALTQFFANLAGGGSREGTGYGLSHQRLFELYRVWRDSTGQDLSTANSHTDDSIDYWIHASVPTLDAVAPIGDQARSSYPELFDYHRNVVMQAQTLSGDAKRRDRAAWWLGAIALPQMSQGFNFRHDLWPVSVTRTEPAVRAYRSAGTGHAFARSGWNRDATWMAFVAGTYDQSHAHQDQGGFTLFRRGFLAVTENIWSHSGIQQGGEVHNVLRFETDGEVLRQREGTTSSASLVENSDGSIVIDADLTPAYAGHPALSSWRRSLRLDRNLLAVHDRFALTGRTRAVFQLNTPLRPVVNGRNARAGDLAIRVLEPLDARLDVIDWRQVDSDFLSGWKIEISGSGSEFRIELDAGSGVFGNGFE